MIKNGDVVEAHQVRLFSMSLLTQIELYFSGIVLPLLGPK